MHNPLHEHLLAQSYIQSCQPLCFGHSLLRPRALLYTATLMIISLRSPSEKQKLCIFDPMCACGHQIRQQPVTHVPFCVSEVLVVPYPISVFILTSWPILAFSSVPALMHHFLMQLVFSHFKLPCRSEKLKAISWVINLFKNHTPKFLGRVLYRNSSVHCSCTINSAPSM